MQARCIPDLVRGLFGAYLSKNRQIVEALLSDDFTFTSPYDDHIDRTAYFERCWPNSERIRAHHIRRIMEDGDEAFVLYDCETAAGGTFRNVERFLFAGDKLKEVEVYFGDPPSGFTKLTSTDAAPVAQISTLLHSRVQAVRKKDVDGATRDAATDMVMFDVIAPLQRHGADSMRERAAGWFAIFDGPIGVEIRDLVVAVSGDLAFSHSLNRYRGATIGGEQIDMWLRATVGFRKVDGSWRIVHEHSSVPFDPATGLASLSLEPRA